ncbi:ATP-binding protein [Streptomyces sp. E11-3]|uniref:ATP-binding protein n=1 Tax=Streptomyces sp. E11-3 TaxID=3110112 RepID=UPI003980C811
MNQQIARQGQQVDVPVRHFGLRLSSTRQSAHLARHRAVQQLDEWGVPRGGDLSDSVALIVAELAANAVTHGRLPGRDFRLGLECGARMVRIEVSDARGGGGVVPVEPPVPSGDDDSGRGLCLVAALASRWGVADRLGPGKTVWAEVDV